MMVARQSKNYFTDNLFLLYGLAIIASMLLSFWINARVAVINPDGICYLYSAEELGKTGLNSAMHLCPQAIWPFYSALIFMFVRVVHVSYTNAAFILDGLFSALSVAVFITIIKELGGSRRVLWFAAATILLAHDFNILRQEIIRDHGFWAFYLLSLLCLLRFFRHPNWLAALFWSLSLLVATLFRIEGAIFLLALPLIAWCDTAQSWRHRGKAFLQLNVLLLLLTAMGLVWVLLDPQRVAQLGRVPEVGNQLWHGLGVIINQYDLTKMAIAENVLNHNSMRDAGLVALLLLMSWYLINVITSLSWAYAFLVMYAWVSKAAQWSRLGLLVVLGYFVVNLVVTFGFFAEQHFLAKRYLVAFSLVMMLWVPFAIDKLVSVSSQKIKYRIVLWIIIILMAMSAIGGILHFGHSKNYLRQAGDWQAKHIPMTAKLYSNNYQLMYYSQHFGSGIFQKFQEYNDVGTIAHGRWRQYDYLALVMNNRTHDKAALVMQEIHLPPIQIFVSDAGDCVYIFQITPQERKS